MRTKGQATVFIIIGIILLLGASIYFATQTDVILRTLTTELTVTERTPDELLPVRSYIENCVRTILEEALDTAMQHGGYTSTENFRSNPTFPTDNSNALDLLPPSQILVPYWYYMESGNNCRENCNFRSEMPGLSGQNSIEQQLENHVNRNLVACLDNFESFSEEGFTITPQDVVKSETLIRDKDVQIRVTYPLKVAKEDLSADMKEFGTNVPSDLTELYTMAKELRDYEMTTCFLEKHTFDYFSQFMGIENPQTDLPPLSKTVSGGFVKKIWLLPQVKENVKQKTFSAVKLIGIFNQTGFTWPLAQPGSYQYVQQ